MKKALLLIFLCAVTAAMPLISVASSVPEFSFASEMDEVRVSVVNGKSVRVQNAMGETMEIYNITGVRIATHKIDALDKTINPGLSRGCYIVKIGKTVRKISIL